REKLEFAQGKLPIIQIVVPITIAAFTLQGQCEFPLVPGIQFLRQIERLLSQPRNLLLTPLFCFGIHSCSLAPRNQYWVRFHFLYLKYIMLPENIKNQLLVGSGNVGVNICLKVFVVTCCKRPKHGTMTFLLT
uniref:Malate dehydrogenase n=1 Tax=Romanomermis culicivorax TaxID=13658 RepID=A0A915L1I3_ROMCU